MNIKILKAYTHFKANCTEWKKGWMDGQICGWTDKQGDGLTGRKEGNVLFNHALNTFYLVIWRQTYGKGPLR